MGEQIKLNVTMTRDEFEALEVGLLLLARHQQLHIEDVTDEVRQQARSALSKVMHSYKEIQSHERQRP